MREAICIFLGVVTFFLSASSSSVRTISTTGRRLDSKIELESPITRSLTSNIPEATDLDTCIDILTSVSRNGYVNQDEYVMFLQLFSDDTLLFDGFDEIPEDLALIFFTAACSSGRDCQSAIPMISLERSGVSEAMLTSFCESMKEVAITQISYKFQYQVQYAKNSFDPMYTMDLENWKPLLENVTISILLREFGCLDTYVPRFLLDGTSHRNLRRGLETLRCDFSVNAQVEQVIPMICLDGVQDAISSQDVELSCAFVSTNLRVTMSSASSQTWSQDKLREIISSTLHTATSSGELQEYIEEMGVAF